MSRYTSNTVVEIKDDSPAEAAGLKEGDRIVSINGYSIEDELDLSFYSHDPSLRIKIKRDNRTVMLSVDKEEYEPFGAILEPLKIRTCKNKCIFCFVHQLPRGLRSTLYVKDEDYRFSFLFGNYVTLSNLSVEDRKRIIGQKMSPLYISVHSTNHELRKKILGNAKATDIMDELKYLRSERIKFHTQIVLCPGYNDGHELENTIKDLGKLHPYMMSIAVVPVGLTKFRKKPLNPVSEEDAINALRTIERFQKKFLKKYGDRLVYGSDELYLKAGIPFPPIKTYGDLPQIENGVGMVPQFIHKGRYIRPSSYTTKKKKYITFTGLSFFPFLNDFIDRVNSKIGATITVVPVVNHFFGESVTVTGLLTGRDIMEALSDRINDHDIILIPDVVLKDTDNVLLDDVSVDDFRSILKRESRVIEPSPDGLMRGLEDAYEYQR